MTHTNWVNVGAQLKGVRAKTRTSACLSFLMEKWGQSSLSLSSKQAGGGVMLGAPCPQVTRTPTPTPREGGRKELAEGAKERESLSFLYTVTHLLGSGTNSSPPHPSPHTALGWRRVSLSTLTVSLMTPSVQPEAGGSCSEDQPGTLSF